MEFSPELESERGRKAKEEGRFRDAIAHCMRILEHYPLDAMTHANLGGIYARMSDQKNALHHLQRARDLAPRTPRHHDDYLYMLHDSEIGEEEHFLEHLKYGDLFPQTSLPLSSRTKKSGEKIRIGYLSSDLHEHATSFILEPILHYHDKNSFEVYLYSTSDQSDETTKRLFGAASVVREMAHLSYEERRAAIMRDAVDILIDLGGHTGQNNLPVFAYRAAPLQISWFSYMDTSGLCTMDYRISDWFRIPEQRERFYTEKILRVPNSYTFLPFKASPKHLPVLTNGFVTFGCFSSSHKITQSVLDTWAEILKSDTSARLMIMIPKSTEYTEWILNEFSRRTISDSRITTLPYTSIPELLTHMSQVDIALDTFPYTAGATAYHALSVGVPMITLLGKKEYERNAAAILHEVGLDHAIAETREEYIRIALALSRAIPELQKLRRELPHRVGKNAEAVVRAVEGLFQELVSKAGLDQAQ